MTTRLITPATALAVSIAEAKLNLRIDDSAQDALIEAWIRGIADHAEHYMGRAIMNQKWAVTLDGFGDAIELCYPPIVSVDSLSFFDESNVLQVLSPADYLLDSRTEPGYIVPAPGAAWPTTMTRINAVEALITCGYGADSSATPQAIRLYILAKLVEQFDPASAMQRDLTHDTVQASFIDRLLDRYKVYA